MTRLAKTLFPAALGLGLTLAAGSAFAGEPPPPTPKKILCHNIGGPRSGRQL